MSDWNMRRNAIAWAQREVNRQIGEAQAVDNKEEAILLEGIAEGLTAEMRAAEQMEMFKAMVRKFAA